MTLNKFIFSSKHSHTLVRHLAFWIVYCSYFYLQSLPPRSFSEFLIGKTYFIALMNLCAFAPVFIAVTYFFVDYLLPNTIMKKRYFLFICGFLFAYTIGTAINYFTAEWFLIITGYFPNTFEHRLEMSNYNTRWGMIIATIALGIKLSKNWYVQQKENLEIVRRKLRTNMASEKARIHPELLLHSLDTICSHIRSGSNKAPSLILDLSEILSYSLYESDSKLVPLEKELTELQKLISLEKQNKKGLVDIDMKILGDPFGKLIVPMILIKTFEESIAMLQINRPVHCQLNSEIIVSDNQLSSDIVLTGLQENSSTTQKWSSLIENTRSRLNEFYTEKNYQVKLTSAECGNTTQLMIRLVVDLILIETNVGSRSQLIASDHDLE